ncbi:MAG: endopeptidase La [Verrucomicrobia bacterium]|nr:endopeptidase La [Verrucomicrobiota bacterium]
MSTPDTEFINILDSSSSFDTAFTTKASPKSPPSELPILGLSDIVIFPGMVAPLLVESAGSIRLVDDAVAGDRFVGLVLQRKPEVQEPVPADLYIAGCLARIRKMLKFPDGTVRVMVEGLRRFRILSYVAESPYLRAKIETQKDQVEDTLELTALRRNVQQQFQEIIEHSPALPEQVKVAALNTDKPGKLTDLAAANVNLTLAERQELLELVDVKERLTRMVPWLRREVEVLHLGSKIQREVASSMSKSQRDFFLREQLRAIQRELGDADPLGSETQSFRDRLSALSLPEEARTVAQREIERMQSIPPSVAEYTVARNYVDWILGLPWGKVTEDKLDLAEAEAILNRAHHGLAKVKDRLLEFIAVVKLRQKHKGPVLCLIGPPGVGKTSLGQSVADALGRKFIRISLGGMRDEAEIRGHRRTYVGAMPGRIIQGLRRVESCNPVLLLDELDKVGADFRGDPAAALLEVLDPQQNHAFNDHYLDLPFDLSRVLFLATANWLDPVHAALRDRLEVIEIPSYTAAEKLDIALKHLLPRQLTEHGLTRQNLVMDTSALRHLVRDYTREAGVRQLEREIAAVTRKVARRIASNPSQTILRVSGKNLREWLGSPKFETGKHERAPAFGMATGLAWTPVGGEILTIEASSMPGKGDLILTGSLGEVMKESARAALSYLRSHGEAFGLKAVPFEKLDLHIHVPAGATPKDGPSAGLAIVIALASLLARRRADNTLAMTGEISLRGRVLRVGGIKEKCLAAARSGITEVILPSENRVDWEEVPEEVRRAVTPIFVKTVAEALPHALRVKKHRRQKSAEKR